jgi:predicted oxidoreductase (fatty acid repression mutant protein)
LSGERKNKTRLQEELANQNDFTRWALEAQSEIGREKISRWKQRELAKLDDNLDDYRPSIDELIEEAKSMLRPN